MSRSYFHESDVLGLNYTGGFKETFGFRFASSRTVSSLFLLIVLCRKLPPIMKWVRSSHSLNCDFCEHVFACYIDSYRSIPIVYQDRLWTNRTSEILWSFYASSAVIRHDDDGLKNDSSIPSNAGSWASLFLRSHMGAMANSMAVDEVVRLLRFHSPHRCLVSAAVNDELRNSSSLK